jgi:hypothetical protein
MQPVTLYITVNITPPNLYSSPSSITTKDDGSPTEEATIPGPIQFPVPEPLSHHQSVETSNTVPQSRESMSPTTSTKDPQFNLLRADEAIEQMVSTDRSNMWKKAVGRIKWVMDKLEPIAEVRTIPF